MSARLGRNPLSKNKAAALKPELKAGSCAVRNLARKALIELPVSSYMAGIKLRIIAREVFKRG